MKVAPAHERPGVSFPRSVAIALVALAIVAITAACGSDGGDMPFASRTPAATSTPSSPSDPSAAFRALEFPAELVDGQAIGKPDARITLTAFEDFQCPFCLRFTILNEPVIVKEYVLTGRVRFEFKHSPILGDESGAAAIASSCAADQGRFWDLHKRLFLAQLDAGQLTAEKRNVGRFSVENVKRFAVEERLDEGAFAACLGSQAAADRVTGQLREAAALRLRGTPSFLLNGRPVSNPPTTPAEWRTFLDEQLRAVR